MELAKEYLDLVIFGLLGLMGFIALWVTLERLIYFRNIKTEQYSQAEMLNIDLTRNLTALSIIGANAPFVGVHFPLCWNARQL